MSPLSPAFLLVTALLAFASHVASGEHGKGGFLLEEELSLSIFAKDLGSRMGSLSPERKKELERLVEGLNSGSRVEGVLPTRRQARVETNHPSPGNASPLPWEGMQVVEEGESVRGSCGSASFVPFMAFFGWNLLTITTEASCSDAQQAYAGGWLEGRVSADQIWDHFQNEFGAFVPSAHLRDYVAKNMEWITTKVQETSAGTEGGADSEESEFWWQVGLLLTQLKGLEAGYLATAPPEKAMTSFDFQLLSLHGDIYDLQAVLALAQTPSPSLPFPLSSSTLASSGAAKEEGSRRSLRGSGQEGEKVPGRESSPRTKGLGRGGMSLVYPDSCSALIKVVGDNEDLVFGHATWTRFETMLRVFKAYTFKFRAGPSANESVAAKTMAFSSYPGRLFSGDDFYLLSSGLAVQETTIGCDNAELYKKYINPENSVLEWMRNMVANRLATSGEDWSRIFSQYNSGTYNNEWMVVDTKRFTPGSPPPPGTLWVLEQLPGTIEAHDMTAHLVKHSYWASYNVPAFNAIFVAGGFAELERQYGEFFSHANTTRARMFRRDHANVVDLPALQRLIRYNDYLHDPLSRCDCDPPYSAYLAIAARGDLNPENGSYPLGFFGRRDHAETDAKISSASILASGKLELQAMSGPTWDQQPPFQWSTSPFDNVTHLGHPDLFAFPWVSLSVTPS